MNPNAPAIAGAVFAFGLATLLALIAPDMGSRTRRVVRDLGEHGAGVDSDAVGARGA